jgi:hypothetical protein
MPRIGKRKKLKECKISNHILSAAKWHESSHPDSGTGRFRNADGATVTKPGWCADSASRLTNSVTAFASPIL